jgi:hypothetical protein
MQPDDDKTQAVTVLSEGTAIDHYRIIKKIGAGGIKPVDLLLPTPAAQDNSGSPSD